MDNLSIFSFLYKRVHSLQKRERYFKNCKTLKENSIFGGVLISKNQRLGQYPKILQKLNNQATTIKMNGYIKNVTQIIQNVFDFLDDMYQVQNFISIRLQMQEVLKKQPFGLTKNNLYTEGTLFVITEGIDLLKDRLEHRSGFKLNLEKTSQLEIVITCQNFHRYHCGFKYLFRKYYEDPQKVQYILVTEFESHLLECLEELKLEPKHKDSFIASPSFRRYKPELQNQLEEISPKILSLVDCTEKLSKELEEEFILLQNKHSTKLYTEQQVTTLKKELQFQSKGLLSKSTQFHPQSGYIVKISFKCKYQNGNCPYLATLNYTYQRNHKHQKLFRLQKVVKHHDNACILDDQDIHYNVVTRKIDENIQILVKILQQNSKDIKPKRVLQLFAQYLSQDPDFIYNGISSKINRRAVKKYFDNSVAKARNMAK